MCKWHLILDKPEWDEVGFKFLVFHTNESEALSWNVEPLKCWTPTSEYVPKIFKEATVIPLHKGVTKSAQKNDRPISLTNYISHNKNVWTCNAILSVEKLRVWIHNFLCNRIEGNNTGDVFFISSKIKFVPMYSTT